MNFLMTNDRELWTFKLPGGGNTHGEMAAAAPPTPGSGGLPPCSRALKRQPLVFSLPPALPQTPVSLIVAANLGGCFHLTPYCDAATASNLRKVFSGNPAAILATMPTSLIHIFSVFHSVLETRYSVLLTPSAPVWWRKNRSVNSANLSRGNFPRRFAAICAISRVETNGI